MSNLSASDPASELLLGVVRTAIEAIQRGEFELGSQLLEGVRGHVSEPSLLDTWQALALIEIGRPREALELVAEGGDDFGWVRDRREAAQALALHTLGMPGWQRIAGRILDASHDPVARDMAARIEALH